MESVAPALAVSRATLYRVVGSRDRLLGEVLWRLADDCLEHARSRRKQDGIEGVLEVIRCFSRQIVASRPLRQFIAREPETAARVLGSPDGGVQRRAIEAVVCLFEEVGLSRRSPDRPTSGLVDDPRRVAYLLVRIVESLCFAEPAGTRPDLDLNEQAVRGLLVSACTPRRSGASRFMDAAMCLMWTSVPDALLNEGRFLVLAGG
jgi:hypothetical protein